MDGEVILPIIVDDQASKKFDSIAKKGKKSAQTLQDAFEKGFDLKLDQILGKSLVSATAFSIGKTIAGKLTSGIKAGIDISNEVTPMLGKLRMALDEGSSVNQALASIEQSAIKARMPMEALTEAVASFGLTSGQYFTNDELINFMQTLSSYSSLVGGADASKKLKEAAYQLQQAFSKGKMQMDDLKPIMNDLPGIAVDLADSLGISVAELQAMTSAGQFTSDKIKQAFLGMSETVQERLQSMPLTLEQRLYNIQNALFAGKKAIAEFFQKIGESRTAAIVLGGIELAIKKVVSMVNVLGDVFKTIFGGEAKQSTDDLSKSIETFSNLALIGLGLVVAILAVCVAHFALVGLQAVVSGTQMMLAGFGVQLGWWPVVLILLGLVLVIIAVGAVLVKLGVQFSDVAEVIGQVLGGAIAFIWNLFLGLLDLVMGIINYLGRRFAVFANFLTNVFKDPIGSIIHLFGDMTNTVLSLLKTIAQVIDDIFGTNLAHGVEGWMTGIDKFVDEAASKLGNGEYQGTKWQDISAEGLGLKRASYNEWVSKGGEIGRNIGEGIEQGLSSLTDLEKLWGADKLGIGRPNELDNLDNYDAATGTGSLSTKLNDESIDELKAFAEIQYRLMYKHVTPNVNITFGDVRETADLDSITEYLKKMMDEDLEELYITEGGQ